MNIFYKLRVIINGQEFIYRGKFIKQNSEFLFIEDIKEGIIGIPTSSIKFIKEIKKEDLQC